tara:strand:- start:882 stop:1898 length:1017 start_codon:yes stop_codon:yes gene_type:complete
MLLIVAHHYSIHGNWNMDDSININRLFVQFLSIGGKLGVNLFVMITGYFMIKSNIKLNSVIKLVSQTWFYSVLFFFINQYFQIVPVGGLIILKSFLPIIFNSYWFITSFVVLFLLIPYLNILINNLDQKQYLVLLMSLIVLNVLIPINLGFGSVDWFIFLYVLGGYISLYPKLFSKNGLVYLNVFFISYFGIFVTIIILDYLRFTSPLYFISENSPFILICSISLFSFFKNVTIKNSSVINTMASSVFGIYLIHDNIILRSYIWENVFKNREYLNSEYLILHAIAAILITFFVSMLIDILRNKLFHVLRIGSLRQILVTKIQSNSLKILNDFRVKYLD